MSTGRIWPPARRTTIGSTPTLSRPSAASCRPARRARSWPFPLSSMSRSRLNPRRLPPQRQPRPGADSDSDPTADSRGLAGLARPGQLMARKGRRMDAGRPEDGLRRESRPIHQEVSAGRRRGDRRQRVIDRERRRMDEGIAARPDGTGLLAAPDPAPRGRERVPRGTRQYRWRIARAGRDPYRT